VALATTTGDGGEVVEMESIGVRSSTLEAIGGTPLVRLCQVVPEGAAEVLVKLEGGNPTGSYKDGWPWRWWGAERRGALRPGQRVVEFTGGSTGCSLAFVCAVKGYPLSLVSSDAFSPEKLRTMRAFEAELTVVPSEDGRSTPDLFVRMRDEVRRIVERDGAFWTDQFHNADVLEGYAGMGREMLAQAAASKKPIDAFCAAVGTAACWSGFREHCSRVAARPGSSPSSRPPHRSLRLGLAGRTGWKARPPESCHRFLHETPMTRRERSRRPRREIWRCSLRGRIGSSPERHPHSTWSGQLRWRRSLARAGQS
jgi:hypothetical protein